MKLSPSLRVFQADMGVNIDPGQVRQRVSNHLLHVILHEQLNRVFVITRAVRFPEAAREGHRIRQRYDLTNLEKLQVADYIPLDGLKTSRLMVPDRQIEFSAQFIRRVRLLSSSAIFFFPNIHWIMEISPDSKESRSQATEGLSL